MSIVAARICDCCKAPLTTPAEHAVGECDGCVRRLFASDLDEAQGIPKDWYLDDARHGIPPLPGWSEDVRDRVEETEAIACPTCRSWRAPLTTSIEQAVGMCEFCISFGEAMKPNADSTRERLRQAAVTVAAFGDAVARASAEMPQDRIAPVIALLEEMAARTLAHGTDLTGGTAPSSVAAYTVAIVLNEVARVALPGVADVTEQMRLRRDALSMLLLRKPKIADIEGRWPNAAFPGLRLDPARIDAALEAAAGRGATRKKDAVAAFVSHALGRKFKSGSFAVGLSDWRRTPAGLRVAGNVRLTAKIAVYEAARAQS